MCKRYLNYGSETWMKVQKITTSTEMDAIQRVAIISKTERKNEHVMEVMKGNSTMTNDIIDQKQLIGLWYAHVRRMYDNRLPKKVLEWTPQEKRRRGKTGIKVSKRLRVKETL